jgi:hypothetical protein
MGKTVGFAVTQLTEAAIPLLRSFQCFSLSLYGVSTPLPDHWLGVIEPSRSAWSSPVVMVKKPNGAYRFCIDFRKINQVSKRDAYPLPYVNSILTRFHNARYFSSIDVKSAYWQIPLSKRFIPVHLHALWIA